jgi:hypothetical protein
MIRQLQQGASHLFSFFIYFGSADFNKTSKTFFFFLKGKGTYIPIPRLIINQQEIVEIGIGQKALE